MRKKVFFVTIPMLPSENLKKITYRKEDRGDLSIGESRFPGIIMIENCYLGNEPVKIISIRTKDDNERTEPNYRLFKEELSDLSKRLGLDKELEIEKEILIEHSENRDKQIQLFSEICSCYEEESDVYMDITYGTKVTPVCMFSTLAYAEKIAKCEIKGVYYGKFSHGSKLAGEFYDVRCLYEIAMLANSAADYIPREQFDKMFKEFWGY